MNANAKFGIFYHDTGTGKTCQIINQISIFQKRVTNFLVLVPNSTIIPQFRHDLIKSCPPNMRSNIPLNIYVSTLNEASSKKFILPEGETVLFYDEAHTIKSVNMSVGINRTKPTNTLLKVYALSDKFNITHSFALTATPMIDSPRELVNILGTMAILAKVDVSELPNMRTLNNPKQFEEKLEEILRWFRSKGAYLSRKKLRTNNVSFPNKDVSQSYFDPYDDLFVTPVEIETRSLNAQRNESIRKKITKENFNQYGKISWNTGFQRATRLCLEDKLPQILKMCKKQKGKSPVLIYSKFKENGVNIIQEHLLENEFTKVSVLTGDVAAKNITSEMEKYNSKENKNGSVIEVMLITGRMATGYNFRNTQLMILVEPDYNPGVLQQAMGRVIRRNIFNNERGHVTIVGLLSVSPDKNQMTLDEQLYAILISKLHYIRKAQLIFENMSIEKIGMNVVQKTANRPPNRFNLTSALKQNLKLSNEKVAQYPRSVKNMILQQFKNIKNKTKNEKILKEAQNEINKLNGCLLKTEIGGNNPMESRKYVCNLKKIKNKLEYLSRKANPPKENRKPVMTRKSTRLLK